MENRENRLFNQIGHRVPRALQVGCAAALSLVLVGSAFAAGCDAFLSGEPAVYQSSVQVRGEAPVKQTFVAGATSDFLVFARERGVDVTLEVQDSAGHVLGRADNPIQRTGVQRLELSARESQSYVVVVKGNDHGDSNGLVDLRVVDLRRAGNSVCLDAQKVLAKADAAYSAGEAVTWAAMSTPAVSSDKSYQEAVAAYRNAATELETAGPSPLLAQAQLAEASVFNLDAVDDSAAAKARAILAGQTYATLGDDYGRARAQAIEGAANADIAVSVKRAGATDAASQASTMLAQARQQLASVVAFHTRRQEFYDAGYAQNYIGVAFYYEARYDEAIREYQKALPLYERLHERAGKARVLQNLALVEYDLGRMSQAIPHFRQALKLLKPEDNPQQYARTLANSALANWASGNQDLALRQYGESLALARTIHYTQQQGIDLDSIAVVYATLGDQARALDFFRQALALLDTVETSRFRTGTLRAMANILRQQGHADEALKVDREALSLAATSSAKLRITVQIARDLIELGSLKEAAENLDTALGAARDEMDRARALRERARLRALTGEQAGAESDLRAALVTFKAYELPIDQFEVWVALAQLLHRRGALTEAFAATDQALALAEEVRLQSANPELRSTLLQPLRPAFDLKISMLSEQYLAAKGNAKEQEALAMRALETAEQARARALADYQTLNVAAPGLDPTLLERRRTLYRELAARRLRLEARLDGSGAGDSRSQTIRSEIGTLRQELDQIDAKIGAASQTALSRRPTTQKPTTLPLNNIPAGVAVIEYWLGSKNSFAWVVTRDGVSMTDIGTGQRINTEATALHTALRSFGKVSKAERLTAGERLYASVLGPIEGRIAGVHTLIFAPDGALHYVPFATLRRTEAGKEVFLVENHDIAVTPSIQMFLQPDSAHPTSRPIKQMLLVDDPVYDPADPRVKNPSAPFPDTDPKTSREVLALVRGPGDGGYLPRLPGAAREAAAIASLMPADGIDRLDGFAANRERFLTSSLEHYRLIHVASHATTDPEIPQASALILSTVNGSGQEIDGRVLAADFLGVRLHADTVVLSACDTALGKSVAGEGLIGLQYIVLARGARSVVSSLWPAIDQVTANVMVKFYSGLLHQHSTVISAWSAANRAALEGPYADPGAWGAFMLTLSHIEDVNSN